MNRNWMTVGGLIENVDQAAMLNLIEQYEGERGEGRTDYVVSELPDILSLPPSYLGTFAWSSVKGDQRWCLKQYCISGGAGQMTYGDMARSYIALKYPKWKGRVNSAQWEDVVKSHRRAPLFAVPCHIRDAVYLDLKSAYWNILKVIGWNVDYHPGKFLGVGEPMDDFPFHMYKLARNCLVTMGLPGRVSLWDGEKIQSLKQKRGKINLVLYACVMDILNSVAKEMIDEGAFYVATDGYIFERKNAQAAFEVARSWGLPMGIKYEGEAFIYAPCTYTIGDHTAHSRPKHPIPFISIQTYQPEWLKKRFSKYAEQRLID